MKSKSPNYLSFTKLVLVLFYSAAILTQLLVLVKVIPYTSVNGGMSKSYSAQAVQSVISIFVLLLFGIFIWRVASKNTEVTTNKKYILYAITSFWLLGLLLQLLGTTFERYVLSFVLLPGVISHILLARNVRQQK